MKRLILAKFNREYHIDEKFSDEFNQALEVFLNDVMLWQAQTGVQFSVETVSKQDQMLMCNITAVVATFETDADFALYKLYMPEHKIATSIKMMDNNWEFAHWRTTRSEVFYE